MDLIFVRKLRVQTLLGVYEWERIQPRTIYVSVDLQATHSEAFTHDSLKGLVNYARVAELLKEVAAQAQCRTVERLAETMASRLIEEFATPWLKLSIDKPGAVAEAEAVGVCIERGRSA